MIDFTEEQLERYSRHIILQDVGIEGQEKIIQGKVLIIGAGGLGSPIAFYLAAAGVGTIGIMDSDIVDLTNLQRQILHFTADVDTSKVMSAKDKIIALNPSINVNIYNNRAVASNIREIIKDYDFIVDGTDSFASKFLVNDACVFEKKPYSHGGILRFKGQTMTILPGESGCLRCIMPEPPPADAVPTCAQAGVLGSVAGMMGTIQATETLKFLTGAGELLTNKILVFDAADMTFRKVALKRNKKCPLCGETPIITELRDEQQPTCDLNI
jgi:molybdopterin/thiamine biosynthesis adenylyltransferase